MKTNGRSLLVSNCLYIVINIGGFYLYAKSNFDHSRATMLLILTFLGMSYIVCNVVVLFAFYKMEKKSKQLRKMNIVNAVLLTISFILFIYTFYALWFANYYDILWIKKIFGI